MVALRKIRLQRYDIILIYANKTPNNQQKTVRQLVEQFLCSGTQD